MVLVIEVMANSKTVLQNCKEFFKIHPFINRKRYKVTESNALAELGRHLQVVPTVGRMLCPALPSPLHLVDGFTLRTGCRLFGSSAGFSFLLPFAPKADTPNIQQEEAQFRAY